MQKYIYPLLVSVFLFAGIFFSSCNNTKEEALNESREIIKEQDYEIETMKRRIDTLEQTIRALAKNRESSDQEANELKLKAQELQKAIKSYQGALSKKEKEFKEYRYLALEDKRVAEIREEKRKLREDNEFIVNKIKQLKQMQEVNDVMDGLTDIIDKIPPFNKFDCYYRDKKDLEASRKKDNGYSPKLLLVEEDGTYPQADIGQVIIDLDLNFFKLDGNPNQATLTLCLFEEGSQAPVFCQDEVFDTEYKRVEWKQAASTFGAKKYYFQVRHGDRILSNKYNFSIKN
ncbi:hypothetical protein [Bernardetia sp.]|uniref:hypothetical protein n=1 Tax=Bernardetia sp. TaxID=1937974 RepID=UPI0025B9212B|nr:hypothetical protein [Bernardetia sp.]